MSNNSKPQTSGSRNIIVLKKTNELQNKSSPNKEK